MRAAAVAGPATRGRSRFTARGAILAIIVTALLLYLVVPLRTYMAQRDHLGQLERQTRVLEQQNGLLQLRIQQLHDPAYLERIARQCLGMAKPGEIVFVVVPKSGEAQPPDC
jgi:cell division protein FtsB